ncbi:MAG: outer membrane beta-barrel protein [Gammaproteobacteria bacterium]
MFKKLLVASAVLAATSTMACAAGAPYLGAGLGLVNTTSGYSNFRGIPLTVFGGYGAIVNQNIYLAGELFANLGTSVLNSNTTFGVPSLRTTYGYGLSFIPGLMLSEHSMVFGRVGVVKTRFGSTNNTRTGGQIGMGLQTSLTQNWDIRGEYDYTKYRNFSAKSDAFNLGLVYKFE